MRTDQTQWYFTFSYWPKPLTNTLISWKQSLRAEILIIWIPPPGSATLSKVNQILCPACFIWSFHHSHMTWCKNIYILSSKRSSEGGISEPLSAPHGNDSVRSDIFWNENRFLWGNEFIWSKAKHIKTMKIWNQGISL